MIPIHAHLKSALAADLAALGAVVYAMTITPTDITSMMVAVTALVTALGIAIVNIIVARATLKKMEEANVKIEEVKEQGKVITGHVNSAATASTAKIVGLENEIRLLRETLATKDQTAAVLAGSAAMLAGQAAARTREDHKPDAGPLPVSIVAPVPIPVVAVDGVPVAREDDPLKST